MAHSNDLRQRVLSFVLGGGSKAEAARTYNVGRSRIYVWLSDVNQPTGKPGPKRNRKVNAAALMQRVEERPDSGLRELGAEFGVHYSTIHYALKRLNYSRKKNLVVRRKTKLFKN